MQIRDRPRRVGVSGSGGLIGRRLCDTLRNAGHRVSRLVRSEVASSTDEIRFLPETGHVESARLEALDAVVHLAGEGIADRRWSRERLRRIRDSRVLGTRLLARALADLRSKPEVLINASAVGFYGERGEEKLDEASAPGDGFLAETCVAWEAETAPAAEVGIRVIHLRLGVVLSAAGGALPRMLPAFRLGIGGRLGHGRQFMSWVSHRDVIGIVRHLLIDRAVCGAVNAVAPTPVRNAEFTRTLERVLGRPAILPLPAIAIRAALGKMGNDLLLTSTRVYPRRLEEARYRFADRRLEQALRSELI